MPQNTVNYFLQPLISGSVPVTIEVGQTFGSGFGDAPCVFSKQIVPLGGYYVDYMDFRISGAGSQAWGNIISPNNNNSPNVFPSPTNTDYNYREYFNEANASEISIANPNGVDYVLLPSYVLSVKIQTSYVDDNMSNQLYAGMTWIEVYLDPNYIVPEGLPSVFDIIIDLDGDAKVIPPPGDGSWQLTVEMSLGELSNCTVLFAPTINQGAPSSVVNIDPWGSPSDIFLNESGINNFLLYDNQQVGGAGGSDIMALGGNVNSECWSARVTGSQSSSYNGLGNSMGAKQIIKWSTASTQLTSTPIVPSDGQDIEEAVWFWIIPNEGYTLMRHNLAVLTTTTDDSSGFINPSTGNNVTLGQDANGDFSGAFIQNLSNLFSFMEVHLPSSSSSATINGGNTTNTPEWALNTAIAQYGNVVNVWPHDWNDVDANSLLPIMNETYTLPNLGFNNGGANYAGTSYQDAIIEYRGNDNSSFSNTTLSSLSGVGSSPIYYTDTGVATASEGSIVLIDTKSASNVTGSYYIYSTGYPWIANGFPYTSNTTQIPTEFCASDYVGNAVLVKLAGFQKYIPGNLGVGQNEELKISIAGAAMNNNSDEVCVDYNLEIELG